MKFICKIPLLILVLFITNCTLPFQTQAYKPYEAPYKTVLFQSYTGKSTENSNSAFAIDNRNIEFEYTIVAHDSLVELKIMMSSGFNEGPVMPRLKAIFMDGQEMDLEVVPVETIHYSQTYNHSDSKSVTNKQEITEPSRTEVVTKSDGKKETVTIPSSTKTIETTQNVPTNRTTIDNKIYNELEVLIKQDQLSKFKTVGMDYYIAYFKKGSIKINVGSFASQNLIKHLSQNP